MLSFRESSSWRPLQGARSQFYKFALRRAGAEVGAGVRFEGRLRVSIKGDPSRIRIGDNAIFRGNVDLRNREQGGIELGPGAYLDEGVRVVAARQGTVRLARDAQLGAYTIINAGADVTIGEGTLLAGFVYVNSSEHSLSRAAPIRKQPHVHAPISIGAEAWIGGHVSVTKGVIIGDGAVIGANSVVTSDIPAYAIAAGTPARVLRFRE